MSHVHVIGAGLAGLSAALSLTAVGRTVTVHEAGPAAGGRCRSYFDRELDLTIDNGNHLLLSGNHAAFDFIEEIGATDRMGGPSQAIFPFVDLKTGERWSVHPTRGRIPWWVLSKKRRPPETRLSDYFGLRDLVKIKGKDDIVVANAVRRGRLYWRLVEPLALAALNTHPQAGIARLLGAVMRETLMKGGRYCIPRFPKTNLSDALIDPAVATLQSRGVTFRFSSRVTGLESANDRVTLLLTANGPVPLGPKDSVLLAVPPWVAADLLPWLIVPNEYQSILNLHYAIEADPKGPLGLTGFLGVLSGKAEWLFAKPGHVSVTISAANELVDEPAAELASLVWPNVRVALGLPKEMDSQMPPYRVIKEKRATFAATAFQEARRPGPDTRLENLSLAGDWTNTGLPATIEGAIRSGRIGANVLLAAAISD